MKRNIMIRKSDKTLYYGSIMELPAKEQEIILECKALFDDAEPCIIHRSYAIHQLRLEFFEEFRKLNPEKKGEVCISRFARNVVKWIEIEDLEEAVIGYV